MIQQLELRSSGMAKDAQGNLLPRLGPDERKLLAWLKIYSAEKRKEWIDACVKSLITMPVV
jgi:hypothetical protein